MLTLQPNNLDKDESNRRQQNTLHPRSHRTTGGWSGLICREKPSSPEVVKDADALIIRTRTICNRELLEGSNVRFIGTATIGFDHIDTAYCQQAGITWSNCPGCNAGAVEQYLHAVLLLLQKEKGINLQESCLGIIGVGHVENVSGRWRNASDWKCYWTTLLEQTREKKASVH